FHPPARHRRWRARDHRDRGFGRRDRGAGGFDLRMRRRQDRAHHRILARAVRSTGLAAAMGDAPGRLRLYRARAFGQFSAMPKPDSQPARVLDVPTYALEAAALAGGRTLVAGIDEAGRGPL